MIVFLDIDGVLNQLQIDVNCVANLAVLVHRLDAKIVLSSTWRFGYTHNFNYCTPQIQHLICKFGQELMKVQRHELKKFSSI